MKTSNKMRSQTKAVNLKDLLSVRTNAHKQAKTKTNQTTTSATSLKKNAVTDQTIAERLARAAGIKVATVSASHTRTPERGTGRTRTSSVESIKKGTPSGSKRTFVDDGEVTSEPKSTKRCLFGESVAESDSSKQDDAIAVALAAHEEQHKKVFRSNREKYAHLLAGDRIAPQPAPQSSKQGNTVEEMNMKPLQSNREKYAHLLAGDRIAPQPAPQEVGVSGVVDETKSRYRYLLDKDRRSLQLPFKYQILLAKFLALETVVMIQQHCRGKTVTFDSARPSVERTCSKEFSMEDLARIKTVFPDSYELTVIHRNGRSPEGLRGTISGYHNGQSSLRISADLGSDLEVDARMAERKEAFTVSLMEICQAAHKYFLSKLPVPITMDDEDIKAWHPDFELDNVPDIKMAELPSNQRAPVPSATDILNRTSDMSTSVKRALEHIVAKQSIPVSPVKKRRVGGASPLKNGPSVEPVQSAPLTLRERIRLKERLQKEEKMREDAAAANGTKNAKTQWECACILRSCSLSKRKNAMPLTDSIIVVRRCLKTAISEVRIKQTLVELTEVVPKWCQIKKVQKKSYFTMNPTEFPETQKYFASRIKK